MFHDHPVNRPNQTGNEMMCSKGIHVERHLCLTRRPIEGLMSSGNLTYFARSNHRTKIGFKGFRV